jgi:hypothetical protein
MHLSSLSKTGTSNTLVVCRFGARRAALAAIASDSNFNFPATIGLCAVLAFIAVSFFVSQQDSDGCPRDLSTNLRLAHTDRFRGNPELVITVNFILVDWHYVCFHRPFEEVHLSTFATLDVYVDKPVLVIHFRIVLAPMTPL